MSSGTVHRCQECGFASLKPGTCPDCARTGVYLALVEERAEAPRRGRRGAAAASAGRPTALRDITLDQGDRMPTG